MKTGERRAFYRKGLSKLYLPYYDALCGILDDRWQPFFGEREIAEQDRLYARGRTVPPIGQIVTRARGGESAHNYGCASDWTLFENDKPTWPEASDKIWQEYQQACQKVGVRWGGDWNADGKADWEQHERALIDCPHNELLIACSWKHVDAVRRLNFNMTQAQEHIERNMQPWTS